jgi:hypothetical protein
VDVVKQLSRNNVLLSVLPKFKYGEYLFHLLKELQGKRVCYVSLNKTAESIKAVLWANHLSDKDVLFIDAVSQGLGVTEQEDNVIYVSSPSALTELSVTISEAAKTRAFDVVVFDSLSTLGMLDLRGTGERFTSFLMGKIKSAKTKAIFVCLKEDAEMPFLKKVCLCVDKVVEEDSSPKKHKAVQAVVTGLVGAALAIPWLMDTSSTTPTGFFIASGSPGYSVMAASQLISWIIIAVAGIMYIHKIKLLKPLSQKVLSKIKPQRRNEKKVRKDVRALVRKWVSLSK